MEPACGGTGGFGYGGCKGEDVVPGVCFDLVNTFDGEACSLAELYGGFQRHNAGAGKRVGGSELYAQPIVVLAGFRPDLGHLRSCVTVDQEVLLDSAYEFPTFLSVTIVRLITVFGRRVSAGSQGQ